MWVFGLELVLQSGKRRAGGACPECQGPCPGGCRYDKADPEAAACPGLLLLAGTRQPPREAGGDGLARNLDGLTVSGTPMYNTRACRSLFILL